MRPTQTLLKVKRSAWKGPFVYPFKIPTGNRTPIKTQMRSCMILPTYVGLRFDVHNGKDYVPVLISQGMVGHKLGEFSPTKKKFTFRATKNS